MPVFKTISRRTLPYALSALSLALAPCLHADTFISEIHYDNSGTDVGEAIEISTETTTNLTGWQIVLYNGSNGTVYNTLDLSGNASPAPGCGENGGTIVLDFPTNGIQNGAPDGIALVNGDEVVQFLSYEGSLTATNGPAAGMTSVDIGVAESGSASPDESLQLVNGVWEAPSLSTFGTCTTEVTGSGDPSPTPTPTPVPEPETVYISEIHYDNAGADTNEAVEISGTPNASIEGWQLAFYNGNNGEVYQVKNLAGQLEAPNNCAQGIRVEAVAGIQNGAPDGVALVNDQGEVIEFISYEGEMTAAGGPAEGLTSTDIGVAESNSTPVNFSLQRVDSVWTPAAENTFGICTGATLPPTTVTPIHEIQGSGSQVTSEEVFTVEAVVVADYQREDQLRGFFIQEEDSDADSNLLTSEGIFVFCAGCESDVSVGDRVRVTGRANDFFEMSQLNATDADAVTVLESNVDLPSPALIELPLAISATDLATATAQINSYYEAFEGMLVTSATELSVAEYFQLGRFGQVVLSANGRPRQFTDTSMPSEAGYTAHQIALAARRIILDDGNNTQSAALANNTPVFFPDGGFSVDNNFRGGDTVADLTGVLHWSWAGASNTEAWRIRAVKEAFDYRFTETNPRSEAPKDVGGRLKVASFNVLNYFTTLDEGDSICGPGRNLGCRGANSPEELEQQTRKIVAAICALDADVIGLMELENPAFDADETPIDTLVSAVNESCPSYAAIDTGSVGTDAITVGIMYRTDTMRRHGQPAILDAAAFTDPNASGRDRNRPAIASTFIEIASDRSITVAVNHLKSKGSSCGEGDDDQARGQANCNLTRTLAAKAQAEWLATYPTGVLTDNVLIIGDLNAYRNEDPIVALEDAGYTDLIDLFEGPEAYGYVFDGQLGYLDHGLASASLLPFVTGATDWHINADEANLLDYNDTIRDSGEASFEAKPSALPLYAPTPYRSSDHDPLVIGIQFPTSPKCHGRDATIYVKDGIIIGGPSDGKAYRGVLRGTSERDVIVGTDERDVILARDGDDFICAGGGDDVIAAGRGYDIISGEQGDDIIFAGSGNDVAYGGDGEDLILGGQGTDQCSQATVKQCEK